MGKVGLQLSLTERLALAAQWAHIEPAPLMAQAHNVQVAINSGSTRELDKLLRALCPIEMWDWPAYAAASVYLREKPTRIRMVAALAHRLLRDDHWVNRVPQMNQNVRHRPIWQLRAVREIGRAHV